jgi:hypothetical protein
VRLPRAEVAELVVNIFLVTRSVRGVVEQSPQRQLDGLARVGQVIATYCLLDKIVVDLDLDAKARLTGRDAPEIPGLLAGS